MVLHNHNYALVKYRLKVVKLRLERINPAHKDDVEQTVEVEGDDREVWAR